MPDLALLAGPWAAWLWPTAAALWGLALGSFGALVADRLPRRLLGLSNEGVAWPPSRCGHCGQRLLWWHNVPVLSHVLLRGRCGFCSTPFGRDSLVLEGVFAVLWGGLVLAWGPTALALAWACFFSMLLVLGLIDARTGFLPDALTLPLCLLGLGAAACGVLPGITLGTAVLSAVLGYAMLAVPAALMARWRRQAVMGGGDPKLMGAVAAWLGLDALLPLLLCSSVLHVLWCGWHGWRSGSGPAVPTGPDEALPPGAVPLGPAMVLAALLVWSWPLAAQTLEPQVHTEWQAKQVRIWAENPSPAPATVQVVVEGRNVQWPPQWQEAWVLPGASQRELGVITPLSPDQPLELRTRFLWRWGDALALPDAQPLRWMFPAGVAGRVSQAQGGRLTTHASFDVMHALDVEVPEETPLQAVRAGWVAQLQSGRTQGGPDVQFMTQSNWVKVVHDDGSVATYAHLSPTPLPVQEGQRVEAGALLGWTGNTGYSSGPHLHLCVSRPVLRGGVLLDICQALVFALGATQQPWVPQEDMWVVDHQGRPAEIQAQRPGGASGRATALPWSSLIHAEPSQDEPGAWGLGVLALLGVLLVGVLVRQLVRGLQ